MSPFQYLCIQAKWHHWTTQRLRTTCRGDSSWLLTFSSQSVNRMAMKAKDVVLDNVKQYSVYSMDTFYSGSGPYQGIFKDYKLTGVFPHTAHVIPSLISPCIQWFVSLSKHYSTTTTILVAIVNGSINLLIFVTASWCSSISSKPIYLTVSDIMDSHHTF